MSSFNKCFGILIGKEKEYKEIMIKEKTEPKFEFQKLENMNLKVISKAISKNVDKEIEFFQNNENYGKSYCIKTIFQGKIENKIVIKYLNKNEFKWYISDIDHIDDNGKIIIENDDSYLGEKRN